MLDSPQNEDVTLFEQPPAEVSSKVEPSGNDDPEAQPSSPTEEKTEEPDNTSASESISLNEESLIQERDHVIDDDDDDNMADGANTNIEWKSLSESPLSSSISDISKPRELKTTCKGDMVVVGSLAGSPSSDASDILKGKTMFVCCVLFCFFVGLKWISFLVNITAIFSNFPYVIGMTSLKN